MEAIQKTVPIKSLTSWRVGGTAEYFFRAKSESELFYALNWAKIKDLPITVLGGGTNMLVSDSGVKGLVIKIDLTDIWRQGNLLVADSGYNLVKLARFVEDNEFCDLSWAGGIPGSAGGAIKGNAGAFGGDMAGIVEWVEIIRDGKLIRLQNHECGFSYRKSGIKDSDIVIRAAIKKSECSKEEIAFKRIEFGKKRRALQPGGYSAGSVFKNPPNTGAGFLIEKAGLKGFSIGGAVVSEKHANFIINKCDATASDIERVIEICKERVMEKFGIILIEEIKRIGDNIIYNS